MGDIVAAYGTSHILFSPQAAPELAQEIVEGMTGLGHRLKDAKPDLVVLITSDHLYNFDLAHQVPFCIGTAASYHAMGDMGIPQRAFRGHVNFAENLVVSQFEILLLRCGVREPSGPLGLPSQ